MDTDNFVTIYYDQFTDLFAIVESKQQQSDKNLIKLRKELEVDQEKYILLYDDVLTILQTKYDSDYVTVENTEFFIQNWQAVKKIEHAVCFHINPVDYNFSQNQAEEIDRNKGGLVTYVQKGKTLPSLDFIRSYQNAIKNFCENRNLSERNDGSTFRGTPCMTFSNLERRLTVIFDKKKDNTNF